MLKLTIFFATLLAFFTTSSAQTIQFKAYKDTAHKISFDIPTYWTIKYSKEQDGVICIPTTKAQKNIYKDCFEGIVFRMDFGNYGLDTLLFQQFDKIGDNYVTSDRVRHDVRVKFIKGKNWKGIRHDNICGISCKENGFHAAAGECQYFYFCKGNKTVIVQTNGRALDDKVITRLLSSFKFID
ncbi:MAG: hypothetical protein ABIO56_11495 [Ferruginibacter sp.]|jgi:hypothetical protein